MSVFPRIFKVKERIVKKVFPVNCPPNVLFWKQKMKRREWISLKVYLLFPDVRIPTSVDMQWLVIYHANWSYFSLSIISDRNMIDFYSRMQQTVSYFHGPGSHRPAGCNMRWTHRCPAQCMCSPRELPWSALSGRLQKWSSLIPFSDVTSQIWNAGVWLLDDWLSN